MKLISYALAILAIAAAGFTGWSAKDNYSKKVAEQDGLIQENANLTQNNKDKDGEQTAAESAKDLALDEESKAKAELEAAKSKATELANTLDSVSYTHLTLPTKRIV